MNINIWLVQAAAHRYIGWQKGLRSGVSQWRIQGDEVISLKKQLQQEPGASRAWPALLERRLDSWHGIDLSDLPRDSWHDKQARSMMLQMDLICQPSIIRSGRLERISTCR